VTGHTDRAGSAAYNEAPSEQRAQAVGNELIRLGVPAGSVITIPAGQDNPIVQTADGVREPRNRRVEIEVLRPAPVAQVAPAPVVSPIPVAAIQPMSTATSTVKA
jgi:flagellar motor protein MotB